MRLVLCAHGTRSPAGREAVAALVADVAARSPVPVTDVYLDAHGPSLGSVLAPGDVVVPLLLAPGHHCEVDVGHTARSFGDVRVTLPLGPSTVLVTLLQQRLVRAGLRPDDALLLAGAGSSRPEAGLALRAVAEDLACALGRPVHPAFISSPAASEVPAVSDVVRTFRPRTRVVAAPYLLASGCLLERLRQLEVHVVARPLVQSATVVDPLLTELVLRRAGVSETSGV